MFLVQNLLYMTRLGLWGPSTAFPNRLDFVKLLNARGVGAARCQTCCAPDPEQTPALPPMPVTLGRPHATC
jgi:P-loop containing NTP hydrolase pore-1